MFSIFDWQKQFDAINRTSNMLDSFSRQMDIVNRFGGILSMLEEYSNKLNALSSINTVRITSDILNKQFETYKALQGVNFSKIFPIQESMQNMSSVLVNSSAELKVYDSFKFTNTIQNALSNFD